MSLITSALADPTGALRELDRLDSEESLIGFTKRAWQALEPGVDFVSGWAVEATAEHLQAITYGQIRRLLINIPPGCTKSMMTNVMWPAWEWGPKSFPHHRFISASYEKGLAVRDLVKCRDLVKSEWYQSMWPVEFKADQDGKENYTNTKTGWRVAKSVGAGVTGWRGDRFIIDDPHTVELAESEIERATANRWFSETVPTRFNKQNESALVVIMQRLHEGDISGHIINRLGEDYVHLCLPMRFEKSHRSFSIVPSNFGEPTKMRRVKQDGEPIPFYTESEDPEDPVMYPQDPRTEDGELLWPERFNEESVVELERTLSSSGGSYAVSSQLQQRPVPRGGGMFKRKWFTVVDKAPDNAYRWCRGWDLAATDKNKAAYTASVKIGMTMDERLVIADVVRGKWEPLDVETELMRATRADGFECPQSIPQDPGQAGKSQKSHYARLLHGYNVHFSPESGSKPNRAIPLAAQAEAGNIMIVRGPWNDAFLAEASLFPYGDFLDQIDAASRSYAYLVTHNTIGLALVPGKAIT